MKTAIYLRCSSEAHERATLKVQKEQCVKYCEGHEWDYEIYCDDGVSGTNRNRPELKRLWNDVELGEIQIIVVWKLDRWSRNVRHALNMFYELKEFNCSFISVTEGYDFTTPAGKMLYLNILGASEFFLDLLKQRTGESKKWKLKEEDLLPQGNPKYGYIRNSNGGLSINEEQAENIRRVFYLFIQGKNQSEIGRMIPGFNQTKVSNILKTECYWTGKYKAKYGDVENSIEVPIIIDPEIVETAHKKLDSKDTMGKPKYLHLLRGGRLICETCGSKSIIHNVNMGEKIYSYYHHHCKKGGVNLPAQYWDFIFWDRVVKAVNNPDIFKQSIQALKGSEYENEIKSLNETKRDCLREIERKKRKKENLLDQLEDKIGKDVQERINQHNRDIDNLRFQIKRIDQKLANLKKLSESINEEDLFYRIKNLKLRKKMSYKEKRKAIENLGTVVYFIPEKELDLSNIDEFLVSVVKKLKGLPIHAEGFLDMDFNENIGPRSKLNISIKIL